MKLSPPGSFGVEVGFDNHRVEKNPARNFYERHRSVPLLIPQPAEAGTTGFIEKNFEQFGRVNVAGRQWILFLGLRCYFTHGINCVQSTGLTALTCTLMTLGRLKKTSPIWDKRKTDLSRNPIKACSETDREDVCRRGRACESGIVSPVPP